MLLATYVLIRVIIPIFVTEIFHFSAICTFSHHLAAQMNEQLAHLKAIFFVINIVIKSHNGHLGHHLIVYLSDQASHFGGHMPVHCLPCQWWMLICNCLLPENSWVIGPIPIWGMALCSGSALANAICPQEMISWCNSLGLCQVLLNLPHQISSHWQSFNYPETLFRFVTKVASSVMMACLLSSGFMISS